MEVNIIKGNDETRVELPVRIDTINSGDFEKAIASVFVDVTPNTVFDCKDLTYISSSGLRIVLKSFQMLKTKGSAFKLVNVIPQVKSVFDMTGFSRVLDIEVAKQ